MNWRQIREIIAALIICAAITLLLGGIAVRFASDVAVR